MSIKPKTKDIPTKPGVYLFKGLRGKILYIGKAKSLKKRVSSYFNKKHTDKIALLVKEVADVDYIITDNEVEALILEAKLIRQHKPKYNVDLKESVRYAYLKVTKEDFPRLLSVRKRLKDKAKYFGPFTDGTARENSARLLRTIFKLRTCGARLPKNVCLQYFIGNCDAPCVGKVSKTDYQNNVANLVSVIKGRIKSVVKRLEQEMRKFSDRQQYEMAKVRRDQIKSLNRMKEHTLITPDQRQERLFDYLYQDRSASTRKRYKSLVNLQDHLNLSGVPYVIECFDISTILGEYTVGSMVQFRGGEPDKSNYRKFKVKTIDKQNDVAAMAEVVKRRYSRLIREKRELPNLIVIDGGKGQLNAAWSVLLELGLAIPIVGLAKKEEEIYLIERIKPLKLSKKELGLKLLIRVRDEAHRFALKYHRLLRGKGAVKK